MTKELLKSSTYSTFKSRVYRNLKWIVGSSRIQSHVSIYYSDEYRGYGDVFFCDFRVHKAFCYREYLNIAVLPDVLLCHTNDLLLLKLRNPFEFQRLIVVADNPATRLTKNVTTWTVDSLVSYLVDLGYNSPGLSF